MTMVFLHSVSPVNDSATTALCRIILQQDLWESFQKVPDVTGLVWRF